MNSTHPSPSIQKIVHGEITTYFITAKVQPSTVQATLDQIHRKMAAENATIALQLIFGGRTFSDQINFEKTPTMLLQGDGSPSETITSVQCIAISGAPLHPIIDQGKIVGNWYETPDARYCLIGNIHADDCTASRTQQSYAVFEKMESLLQQANMEFTDIARTWLYLTDLLDWYDDFNTVRTQFFNERKVFQKMVPASTGIGAGSPEGEAIICALLAVKPKTEKVTVSAIPSPLQCPALDYKSSFSRAVEIDLPSSRLLTISGTASIEMGGKTAHLNDHKKQVELTMQVVHEILKSRQMDWSDTVRAIAYFKDPAQFQTLELYCKENGIEKLPIAYAHTHICRDDLLFELELDAVKLK